MYSKDNENWGTSSELYNFIIHDSKKEFNEIIKNNFKDYSRYKVKSSTGLSKWAICPWIRIFDEKVSPSPKDGFYIVYLFNADMSGVNLTLAMGVENQNQKEITDNKKNFRESIVSFYQESESDLDFKKFKDLDKNNNIDLKSNSGRPKKYEKSVLFSKYYSKDNIPEEETLLNDLHSLLEIYDSIIENEIFENFENSSPNTNPHNTEEDTEKNEPQNKYTTEKFLEEVYIDKDDYKTIVNLLTNKKNLIIQGAPGVGKTFVAKRLAYAIMGLKDDNRIEMIQFHQSYSYEDFIEGYRPIEEGFELQSGTFKEFCEKADKDKNNDYFFIIDEINRGNLSKIFGELFMLIETDKRGDTYKIKLLYSKEPFYIPENVHIIGLMNTADRSIAMIDYALRRRFAFFDLEPGFDSDGFKKYIDQINNDKFNALITCMKNLNNAIEKDESLRKGFRIGHSYLCDLNGENIEEDLEYIVEYEIIPLLNEYWFDEPDKVSNWSEKLKNCLNDS